MLRAIALAARLDFRIDEPVLDAIRHLRRDIARSSPARLLDEYYKILRGGSAERTFRGLLSAGLLEPISEELHMRAGDPFWRSLAALDAYRANFAAAPDTLTNPVLLGTLLVPLGLISPSGRAMAAPGGPDGEDAPSSADDAAIDERDERHRDGAPPGPQLGSLPLARRDLERLRQILGLQRRLRDTGASPRAKRALTHRNILREALTWLELHGHAPDVVEHWISVLAEQGAERAADQGEPVPAEARPARRRRRRRRRRRGPVPGR
jgi:poly(A) polymerase